MVEVRMSLEEIGGRLYCLSGFIWENNPKYVYLDPSYETNLDFLGYIGRGNTIFIAEFHKICDLGWEGVCVCGGRGMPF